MNSLVLSKRAIREIEEIYLWYEKAEKGLVERFKNTLNEKLNKLLQFPKIGSVKKPPYHDVSISVFPYSIIYRYNKNIIFITSVYHFKRNPLKKY